MGVAGYPVGMDLSVSLATWMDYLRAGGAFMWLMLIVSIFVVAVVLERVWALFRAKLAIMRMARVVEAARKGNLEEARKLCDGLGSPFREVLASGLDRASGKIKGEPSMAMLRGAKKVVASMRAWVWILGTTGALMPFVGLLGTVLGVMSSFQAIGASSGTGFAVVSAGISEALIATAAGLFVALEAVIAFNILQNVIATLARDVALLVDEMSEILETWKAENASSPAV